MTLLTRLAGRRPSGEDGVALLVAVGVASLVAILCVTLVTLTVAETRGSGRERQRAEAVQFAEGQVDTTLARIQSSSPSTLPCNGSGQSAVSGPDVIDATTTVTYYDAAGNQVACSAAGPAGQVTSALVSTTATSQALAGAAPAERTVETLIKLTPTVEIDGLDKAIFGNSGVALANNGEVFGQNGLPDADVYTNGSFTCNNNQDFHGSIYAQGQISMASTCTVDVDAWAGTGFRADNTGVTIKGDVKVGNGNAVFNAQGATVAGTVTTSGTITGNQWRTRNCPAKCIQNASPGMPPAQAFPQLTWDGTVQAAWAAAGYVNVVTNNSCNTLGDSNGPGKWIMDNAATLTQPTILRTTCNVKIQKQNNLVALKNNLAVFADGGFEISNSLTIRSTNASQQRNLYFIQPYNAPSCGSGVSLDNRVTLEASVDLLLYSKCNVRKANNADHFGQIYAGGTATIDNRLTMYYKPLPVFGIANQQTVLTGYTLDVVYKRENIG